MIKQGWNEPGKFLLDGFPRNIENYNKFTEIMSNEVEIRFMFYIELDEMSSFTRLKKRARDTFDFNEDHMRKRLNVEKQQTTPVIEIFKAMKKYEKVDGSLSIEDVSNSAYNIIQDRYNDLLNLCSQIVFITSNKKKAEEFKEIMGNKITSKELSITEIQGTPEEIIKDKVLKA